jgi:hypothetical protein
MNSSSVSKRLWLVGAILALSLFLAFTPVSQVLADINPIDPPINQPADTMPTPHGTIIGADPGTNTAPLTAWDILYAIIVAL